MHCSAHTVREATLCSMATYFEHEHCHKWHAMHSTLINVLEKRLKVLLNVIRIILYHRRAHNNNEWVYRLFIMDIWDQYIFRGGSFLNNRVYHNIGCLSVTGGQR